MSDRSANSKGKIEVASKISRLGTSDARQWSTWHWWLPVGFIFIVVPTWVFVGGQLLGRNSLTSATTCILIGALGVSAYTDLRQHVIPNWVTYPGIAAGFSINVADSLTYQSWNQELGAVGISASILGFTVLFVGLLVIFSMSGGGAGDVKLVGAIGALLGVIYGVEAVCLSFVLCAGITMVGTLLRMGPLRIIGAIVRKPLHWALLDWIDKPEKDQEELLVSTIPLAPFFALGTLLVLIRNAVVQDPQSFQFMFFG